MEKVVSVNINQLKAVFEYTPAEQNIMLIGDTGIGKSQIVRDFYETKGFKVKTLMLGQLSDIGDVIGLPVIENNRTRFAPPFWYEEGQPIVLFLDELNRARTEILNGVMELALNKEIAGTKLPEGSIVVAAVNEGDDYHVNDLDPALRSRFNAYHLEPTVTEWLSWALLNQVDLRIIDFIKTNNSALDGKAEKNAINRWNFADRRAWVRLSNIITKIPSIQKDHWNLIAGVVGQKSATEFLEYVTKNQNQVSPEQILFDWSDQLAEKITALKIPEIVVVNDRITNYINAFYDNADEKRQNQMTKSLFAYIDFLFLAEMHEPLAKLAQEILNGTDENRPHRFASIIFKKTALMNRFREMITQASVMAS